MKVRARVRLVGALLLISALLLFQNCGKFSSYQPAEVRSQDFSSTTPTANPTPPPPPPAATFITLRSFGAVGDGVTDDTAAVRRAFASNSILCLEGENLTYRVIGTIRADRLCLQNTIFKQDLDAMDTSAFFRPTDAMLAPIAANEATRFSSSDPTLTDAQHSALEARNNLRTIFVTGNGSSPVTLKNVKVNKGRDFSLGNAGNAAGIYITDASPVNISNVEVFGRGQGYAVFIHRSKNVAVNELNIHDIMWSLAQGNRLVSLAELRDKWVWNNLPIYMYDPVRRKFGVSRSQEMASGLVISGSENVEVANSRVSGLLFNVEGRHLPWQSDGITVTSTKGLKIRDTRVNLTWEGIDISGGDTPDLGVSNYLLQNLIIENSFYFGLKIVHAAHRGTVLNATITNSGLYGVAISGPVVDLTMSHVNVSEVGLFRLSDGSTIIPIPAGITAGFSVRPYSDTNRALNGEHIRIVNSNATNSSGRMTYGFWFERPELLTHTVIGNINASGVELQGAIGEMPTAYSYGQTVSEYQRIIGCTGALGEVIRLWDQSHDSVRSPVWTLANLQAELASMKTRNAFTCAP